MEFIDLIIIIAVSFCITILVTPFTIKVARRFNLVDDPTKRPHPAHVHNRIVPRAGGLAIYLGLLFSSAIFISPENYLFGLFLSLTILLVTGLLDDKLANFNPYVRLLLLFTVAGIAVTSGVTINFITNPLQSLSFINPTWSFPVLNINQIPLLSAMITIIWIVTITQILNWSKGVDGQMPGISLMTALTLGFLSLKFFYQGDASQLEITKLAFIVAGVSLGFLIFNWYPAKIFPGFSGSTILAFMLAVLSVLSGAKLATAILVLAVPSADFIYTFLRRILSGKSPVWGDRGHLHHRLLDLGWSHKMISLFYIFGSAILGLFAVLIDVKSKAFIVLGLITLVMSLILWLNSFLSDDTKEFET